MAKAKAKAKKQSLDLAIALVLNETQWSELYYAVTSKMAAVDNGVYGSSLTTAKKNEWMRDLNAIASEITKQLDKNGVTY